MENQDQTPPPAPVRSEALGSLADNATGRDLDALVANHVMGWNGPMFVNSDYPNGGMADSEGWDCDLPEFSTDGNAMLTVLEELRERFPMGTLLDTGARGDKGWQCIVDLGGKHFVGHRGNTAPEAVCRAALKAVNEQGNL